jgi:hypothetical protein
MISSEITVTECVCTATNPETEEGTKGEQGLCWDQGIFGIYLSSDI